LAPEAAPVIVGAGVPAPWIATTVSKVANFDSFACQPKTILINDKQNVARVSLREEKFRKNWISTAENYIFKI
jgi:hypothetical protein